MSLARERVRERGTWRVFAVCASVVLCVVTATPRVASASPRTALVQSARPVVKTANTKKAPKPERKRKKHEKHKKDEPKTIPDMIRDEFDGHADDALRVASCESKFDPNAYYGGAVGVFQIMASAHDWRVKKVRGRDLHDARTNIRVARHLFEEQGWQPWTCARIVGVSA
jgi:hypothetical protein